MRWRILFIGVLLLTCSGCLASGSFVKYETKKLQSVKEARDGVTLMLQGLEFRSGLLDGVLGPYKADLPPSITAAFKDLKVLVKKYKEEGKLSEYEMGLALGIQIRLRGEVAQAIIKKYCPSLLKYIML